ncbi:MAG: type I DNA topoisomerase [Immundisolibacteraceae bacterium]|nr:type I DNA topoisomerase [Immundisolibacteraceae bacterium]
MVTSVVVVESPAKAKTINRYLGKDYKVLASYGHVRDLIAKEGAVDYRNGFHMNYQPIERNGKHVQAIAKALKPASELLLATDPDREGEAIAWHLCEELDNQGLLKGKTVKRVVFNEITDKAVNDAVANPGEIQMDLVNAQQARRALDYLVGFNISPLLWRKIRPGLSAGRVQSPALRLIAERELEIEKFVPREYWTIEAEVETQDRKFAAKLVRYDGEALEQFSFSAGDQARSATDSLTEQAGGFLTVTEVKPKQRKRNPLPPFTTSTLQQESSRKLGFTAQRTMRIAQQLYEGIDIGGESIGLITYMRTDSVSLAQEAMAEIREVITAEHGADSLPDKPRTFKNRSKNAQEAHEAIRPSSATRLPTQIKSALSADQLKLYTLIWQRTIACQMIPSVSQLVTVEMSAGSSDSFRATGSVLLVPGYLAVYKSASDGEEEQKQLPKMAEGERLALLGIECEQHFTEPPPRFNEASLIKTLEEHGIGRPSTYASIISTLQQREYALLDKKRFIPTDVGMVVNRFLTNYFTQYVDYDFTAKLEDDLDAVARGEGNWVPLLEGFWEPFHEKVVDIEKTVTRKDVTQQLLDENCPECGKPLALRLGKRGNFIGCTNYPDCSFTRNADSAEQQIEPEIIQDRTCPKCDKPLLVRVGKYGKFIGCSGYPDCKYLEPLDKPKDTGVSCPKCDDGSLMERKSRRGKVFFSCSKYPKCDYATWNQPVAEPCPECSFPITTIKTTKKRGTEKVCPEKECSFSELLEGPE